ncbi:short-chain dehydrogenase/reductase, partial [Pseudomonas syringae pv. tagetis]
LKEYDQARARVRSLLAHEMPKAELPHVVAAVLLKAAEDARPRQRYAAGKTAPQISILRRLAPDGVFDKKQSNQLQM